MADLKTIHEIRFLNAKKLMDESGLKRKEFAEKIDMSYSLLSQYLGKNPTKNIGDDTAEKIEDAFNKPRGYLDQSSFSIAAENSFAQKKPQHMNFQPPVDLTHSENPRQTPVLSWVQAGDFSYVLSSDLSGAIDWIPYDPRAGESGFALIVKGTSMEPDFKPNEFIYINPTYQIDELHTGALVVMACEGDTEATFKKLISEDENYYLQPLNPNWHPQIIELDYTCRLVGKVVGKYTRY
ncbi:LexA family transcriptional regulator [Acinetobacter sp. CFCC 10889]|uniref:LexA family transcriptional regulator n=1 Tax=Acinetobacter sp. CFCC 10889 TaxID=1775557 RepID=UPI000DD084C5|nr:LexA family transcriptional regulator [Acinetobacter sp. CFCC 10889]